MNIPHIGYSGLHIFLYEFMQRQFYVDHILYYRCLFELCKLAVIGISLRLFPAWRQVIHARSLARKSFSFVYARGLTRERATSSIVWQKCRRFVYDGSQGWTNRGFFLDKLIICEWYSLFHLFFHDNKSFQNHGISYFEQRIILIYVFRFIWQSDIMNKIMMKPWNFLAMRRLIQPVEVVI